MAQILLGTFTINDNTANLVLSSYNNGDQFKTYFDDILNTLVVELNGSVVTSGPAFIWNDEAFPDAVTIKVEPTYSYCSATTLISYKRITPFPYFEQISEENSPSCKDEEIACDIQFIGSFQKTKPTSKTSLDGSIKVTVFSSNGPVQFSDSPFNYGEGAPADSISGDEYTYTFTGWGVGRYIIYVADEQNCKTQAFVQLSETQSYVTKYYFDFQDVDENTYRVNLKQKGYSGSSTEISYSGSVPVEIEYGPVNYENKFTPIIGCGINVSFISETSKQYLNEFNSISEKEWLVEVLQSSVVLFTGYAIPEIYQEPSEIAPYALSLTATDGLADLDKVDFKSEDTIFKGDQSVIETIAFCLEQTGLSQSIRVGMNLYETSFDSGVNDDPLEQLYTDLESYRENEDPISCVSVLSRICTALGLRLFSSHGYWYLLRISELTENIDYREFNANGVNQNSAGTISVLKDIKGTDDSTRLRPIARSNLIRFDKVYSKIKLNNNRIIKNTLVNSFTEANKNGNGFEGWTPVLDGALGDWVAEFVNEVVDVVQTGTERRALRNEPGRGGAGRGGVVGFVDVPVIETRRVVINKLVYSGYFISAGSLVTSPVNSYIKYSGSVEYKGTDKFVIDISVFFRLNTELFFYQKLKWRLKVGSYYYEYGSNTWTTTETDNEFFVEQKNKIVTFNVDGDFREEITENTTEAYELRLYGMDHLYADVIDDDDDLQSDIQDVDVSNLSPGTRIIGRKDKTEYEMYFFTLENSTRDPDGIAVVKPTLGGSTKRWLLEKNINYPVGGTLSSNVSYENAIFFTLPGGEPLENTSTESLTNSEDNANVLNYDLWHFDLDTGVNNAENLVTNYWKKADGTPTSSWGGQKYQKDLLNTVATQYKFPSQILSTNLKSDINVYLYNSIRNTLDNNRIFMWGKLEIDLRNRMYNGELVEIGSDTEVSLKAFKDNAFTEGFK